MFVRRSPSIFALSLALSVLGACTQESKAPGCTPATTQAHGDPHAVLGSHEDWCGEHAVPESKCTRCDSALAAAFKATGDWCAEHGLPESQCLKCNPDLEIIRPPKTGGE